MTEHTQGDYDRQGKKRNADPKYTEGPWYYDDHGDFTIMGVDDWIAIPQNCDRREANAKRIVHCVNLHDEMTEALESALDQLVNPSRGPSGTSSIQAQIGIVIAKAKGESS